MQFLPLRAKPGSNHPRLSLCTLAHMPDYIVRFKGWKKENDAQRPQKSEQAAIDAVRNFSKDRNHSAAAAFRIYGGGDFTLLATKNVGARTTPSSWADGGSDFFKQYAFAAPAAAAVSSNGVKSTKATEAASASKKIDRSINYSKWDNFVDSDDDDDDGKPQSKRDFERAREMMALQEAMRRGEMPPQEMMGGLVPDSRGKQGLANTNALADLPSTLKDIKLPGADGKSVDLNTLQAQLEKLVAEGKGDQPMEELVDGFDSEAAVGQLKQHMEHMQATGDKLTSEADLMDDKRQELLRVQNELRLRRMHKQQWRQEKISNEPLKSVKLLLRKWKLTRQLLKMSLLMSRSS